MPSTSIYHFLFQKLTHTVDPERPSVLWFAHSTDLSDTLFCRVFKSLQNSQSLFIFIVLDNLNKLFFSHSKLFCKKSTKIDPPGPRKLSRHLAKKLRRPVCFLFVLVCFSLCVCFCLFSSLCLFWFVFVCFFRLGFKYFFQPKVNLFQARFA